MRYLLSAGLIVCLMPFAHAQPQENPFKKAKVGDWAEYKASTSVMGMNFDLMVKMTVTDIDDKEATISTVATVKGMQTPAQTTKIDLTKPYDPTSAANIPKDAKAKVEKLGDGKEKITVGGKSYDTQWTKLKVLAENKGVKLDSEIKVWLSKDVPLSGMVKMEMMSNLANMTMELAGTGRK